MTLEESYNETGPKIVGYLVATGTDEATALDLLHDAVVRVARWLEENSPPDNLPSLLFTTTRNLRANRVRHDARIDFVGDVREDEVRQPESDAHLSTSDAAYLRNRIAVALRELPEAQREAYVLYQIGGRSVREVAEMTGAGESLVKVRIHRAKKSLRKSLADWKER